MSFNDGGSMNKVTDGTWVVSVDPGTALYTATIEVEGALAEANITLTWPDQPGNLADNTSLNNSTDTGTTCLLYTSPSPRDS